MATVENDGQLPLGRPMRSPGSSPLSLQLVRVGAYALQEGRNTRRYYNNAKLSLVHRPLPAGGQIKIDCACQTVPS